MSKTQLFRTNVDKDLLWDTYLSSFPEGTNPIYKERTEHDCQSCRQFIRASGNVVTIKDNKLVSIWDVEVGGSYQVVVDALSKLVKSNLIADVFLHYEQQIGTDFNNQMLEDGEIIKWNHLHFKLPTKFVMSGDRVGTKLSELRSNKEVFKRGLDEITLESVETVLELIEQNSIYRGAEHKGIVELFLKHKDIYDKIIDSSEKDNYCWDTSIILKSASKIRNTVIGTLLVDISDGKPLDASVKSFETKVAPANYKRPTALVTKSMIDNAQKKVEELGIGESLQRRYAVTDDITINNVLFANREVKKSMNVFDELKSEAQDKLPNLKKVDEVDIKTFIEDVVPKADKIELLFDNSHTGNLMSLIAPVNKDSKRIFKWDNNFSWSYNGEVTDSIKERVKKAGGSVTGDLRCSLSWFNYDDLDIHLIEPKGGVTIYYGRKSSPKGGKLDVDMNAGGGRSRNAVENITYKNKAKMIEGKYVLKVHQFSKRETVDVGFDVEIEFGGEIHSFHYDKPVSGYVTVAEFEYTHAYGIKIIKSLPSTKATKEVWGINTQKFQNVSMIMNSPNHWDDHITGNKHWFFMLEGCKNQEKGRGFYNEFLSNDLTEHRKVFEVLGSKMKTEKSNDQLSGLGFSSTQRNSVYCRVTGSFSRTIKINF
ncbi:hypothetical protein HOE22_02260 [Candidatus Woesearchaeota archaeon]|nr:hypothetical protein [Candidatus Woesearchaeota archaeon]